MAEGLALLGFGPSVYTRIAKMALISRELTAEYVEVDPFSDEPDVRLIKLNPVGRVPVLQHGDFILTETAAITRYLNTIGSGDSLVPAGAKAEARMAQVIGLVDAQLYQRLVRKAFGHGVFAPRAGLPHDPALVGQGVAEAMPALQMLNAIAAEGLVLNNKDLTLADLHLAPMIEYGLQVAEARTACDAFPALMQWWDAMAEHQLLIQTRPPPFS